MYDLLASRYQLILSQLGGLNGTLARLPIAVLSEIIRRPAEYTVVVTPTQYVFDLTSPYGFEPVLLSGDIYAVSDIRGRLLYQVARHGGIWGRNELDAKLVFAAQPWELYFLNVGGGLVYTLLRGLDTPLPSDGKPVFVGPSNPHATLIFQGTGTVYSYAGKRSANVDLSNITRLAPAVTVSGIQTVILEQDSWVYMLDGAGLPSSAVLPGDKLADGFYYVRATGPDAQVVV